ncbi:MAG: GMC family oxidoreductase N-terminal domain-containing protein, partial [Sphingobium sp.]
MAQYDVVVVGGGTAGCIVAARLSEDPSCRVLLLEAGGSDQRPEVQTPEAWATTLGTELDYFYQTTVQRATGRSYACHRGRVLGGSSSINLMTHIRGHRQDFDNWAYMGANGWGYEDVLPYFKRSEDVPGGDPRYRGQGGPLMPRPSANPHPLSHAHVAAARALGHVYMDDVNGPDLMGTTIQDVLIENGMRQSPATAYLRPAMERPNLEVRTGVQVRRLAMDGTTCTGVEYVADGKAETVRAGRVVLTAGAIDSPKLMLLSGIGPADELTALGIGVTLDLPGVGGNLHDHILLAGIRYHADRPLPPPSGNLAESTLFTRTLPGQIAPELQIVQVQVDYHTAWQQPVENSFTFGIGHMRPQSRGSLKLASSDPSVPPLIDYDYLGESYDLDQLIAGVEEVDRMTTTGAFDEWGGRSGTDAILSLGRK